MVKGTPNLCFNGGRSICDEYMQVVGKVFTVIPLPECPLPARNIYAEEQEANGHLFANAHRIAVALDSLLAIIEQNQKPLFADSQEIIDARKILNDTFRSEHIEEPS